MLVGFPAGGGVDIVARLLAVEMQKTLGQPITVDNRAGAAGNIATEAAARAAPDGYTILMGNTGSLAINPAQPWLHWRLAKFHARDGERDAAFAELQAARQGGVYDAASLRDDPAWAALRGDPRWTEASLPPAKP
jgi:hypothetical protein